ncbi:hypothetical protein [Parasphaerochaeta coccoides]|uniref:GGDEF domain-containing protein n=1 Tax=Parasphaerochaeta coccoides (strain ATCC BAA-1237 / DSM 17374 / SPN1) TaxID=760011 RepID=F4GJD2_PARC1|nr:hypothetical protein [Parasphaerochaeta coccoides]AEC01772.1 hypothetical protein Spico_0544 [Parasphaerochaeta coccoides DSM 17374]
MAETTHYGKRIFLTLLVTIIALAVVTYGVVTYIFPASGIELGDVRPVLIKLFPLLIGLAMIEIGVLIARRREEDRGISAEDKLPPNSYDQSLYVMPGDDPVATSTKSSAPAAALEAPVRSITPPLLSEPVSVPLMTPNPAEARVIPPGMTIYAHGPIETGTGIIATLPTFEDTFDSVLEKELADAIRFDYDISLAVIAFTGGNHVDIVSILLKNTLEAAFAYELENGKVALIFSLYTEEDARSYLLALLDSLREQLPGIEFQIGLASRAGRDIDAEYLYAEAETAELDASFDNGVTFIQ